MWHVAILDLISLLAFWATLIILIKGWRKSFPPDAKLLFLGLIVFSQFYSASLFMQWSGLSDAFEPIEDVIGALLPMFWAFFFYTFLQDVVSGDLRQSKEALLESERKLSTLIGNLPGMVYRCLNDKNLTMEFISEGCRQLTEYEATDFLLHESISFGDLIHKDDRNAVRAQVRQRLAEKQPFQLEYRIHTASGEEKWVWEQGVGIFSDDGELLAREGFITDITPQKRAQEALRKASEELEEKVKSRTVEITEAYKKLEKAYQKIKNDQDKILRLERHAIVSRISSTLAHETRNPISAIGGVARLLKRKHATDPDLASLFGIILEEIQKLERLIAGILKAAHDAPGYFQKLDVHELITALVMLTQEKARLSNVELKIAEQPSSVHIVADKESIIVALREILLNAIEASPQNEDVAIKVNREEERVVISVADRGPGIDEQSLARIYDPVFSTKKLSSGLGLSFAKELIEAQNGYIRIQTRLGQGTTFSVHLPLAK